MYFDKKKKSLLKICDISELSLTIFLRPGPKMSGLLLGSRYQKKRNKTSLTVIVFFCSVFSLAALGFF